ncbi:MAG: NlpC/P60 family protein, partial [Pseudomonadota bacterium]
VEAARFAEPVAMTVIAPIADLRPTPDEDARLDTQLLHGEGVAAYEIGAHWAWVQAATDGYVGYVPCAALGPATAPPTHRVSAAAAHVYPVADIKAPPVARLPGAARLAVTDTVAAKGSSNAMAMLAGGGFVPRGQIMPLETLAPDWVAEAEAMLGAPYLWGGRSRDGLDCSALLQLALAAAGHAFPRDSDMQLA